MDNSLTITGEASANQIILKLQGRLDANNASYLDDRLTELIREGHYIVWLDMSGVVFLSSAGIRILVKQHKAFRLISGELGICLFSESVQTVLEMVGMVHLFKCREKDAKIIIEVPIEGMERFGYRFIKKEIQEEVTNLAIIGNPHKIREGTFTQEDSHLMRLLAPRFALGIGAFGPDFSDCQSRYGEFIALGNSIAYLPSEATDAPDYMIRTGNLVPEISVLYGLGINDSFQQEIRFIPEGETSLTLGDLAETLAELGNHTHFAMLMIAESNGLVGASLRTSPVSGINPFSFPEVRDRVRFTTEPAHVKSMTVCFGIFSTEPDDVLAPFLRPVHSDGKLKGHVHSAIFTYTPLQKEDIDYKTIITALFNDGEIIDVMHLLNDNRDISGIGQSTFKSGHCWTTELIF